jgi:hypothetical protein
MNQAQFKIALERYNLTIDILEEAKKELWLNMAIPKKVEICDNFSIIDVDIEKNTKYWKDIWEQ